jgi:hypothetical protein
MKTTTIIFLSTVLFCAVAFSQEKKSAAGDTTRIEDDANLDKKGSDVKMFMDKIEILGRIERPQTVFILPGKDPSADDIHLDRSFFKEIFRFIEKEDYRRRALVRPPLKGGG